MSAPTSNKHPYSFVFFGTPQFGTDVLEELKQHGFMPARIVTAPDKPSGRKLLLTPPSVKLWAEKNSIPYIQPEILSPVPKELADTHSDFFVVAAYGKIIPKAILELPHYGTLNVHPSLLPKFRGASPIQSAILHADITGATIMLVDEELDHGPIIAQEILDAPLPISRLTLETMLAHVGGRLLSETIPEWVSENIEPQEQAHAAATYTKKIKKEDGLVELSELKKNPDMLYRKFCAYEGWPSLYFFIENGGKNIRVIIKEAALSEGVFVIKKVLPEGKTLMSWSEFESTFTL